MNNIKQLEKEIKDIISKSPSETDLPHAESTRKWVLELKPDADLALQIAALAHDIDRGFEPDYFDNTKERFDNYKEHKRIHSEKGAKIIVDLLKKNNFDEKFISQVEHLVLEHEFGGDVESDILMDADSISFFDDLFEYYYEKHGEDETRNKVNFAYNRMSNKTKEIVRKFNYDNIELDKIFKEEIKKYEQDFNPRRA